MKDLHRFDAPFALLFGVTSVFHRILLFLGCIWFAAVIGIGFAGSGEVLEKIVRDIERDGLRDLPAEAFFRDALETSFELICTAPIRSIGLVVDALSKSLFGVLLLPLLGVAFVLIVFTDHAGHGAFLLLYMLPIQNLVAINGFRFSSYDLPWKIFPWLYLALYLAAIVWLYLQFLRSMYLAQ